MSQANLEAAFALANKWREASGQEIMSAWFPSIPEQSNACLLARAFNKNCYVSYDTTVTGGEGVGSFHKDEYHDEPYQMRKGSGLVSFNSEAEAQEFAAVAGLKYDDGECVYIPDEIALVAWEFDCGAYPEYVEKMDAA